MFTFHPTADLYQKTTVKSVLRTEGANFSMKFLVLPEPCTSCHWSKDSDTCKCPLLEVRIWWAEDKAYKERK
jgi:hypothetical protein